MLEPCCLVCSYHRAAVPWVRAIGLGLDSESESGLTSDIEGAAGLRIHGSSEFPGPPGPGRSPDGHLGQAAHWQRACAPQRPPVLSEASVDDCVVLAAPEGAPPSRLRRGVAPPSRHGRATGGPAAAATRPAWACHCPAARPQGLLAERPGRGNLHETRKRRAELEFKGPARKLAATGTGAATLRWGRRAACH